MNKCPVNKNLVKQKLALYLDIPAAGQQFFYCENK
jgi:hypothetical protein